ncbi:Alpha/beta hydrolase fold-1 [Apiospora arundinis]
MSEENILHETNRNKQEEHRSRHPWTLNFSSSVLAHWKSTFQYAVPLTKLPALNRVALGIRNTAKTILVSIHVDSIDTRVYCSTDGSGIGQSSSFKSSSDANFLTYLMAKKLRNHCKKLNFHLKVSGDLEHSILQIARDCQTGYDEWPTETRLSPLLREPSVMDLLLTCLTAQLRAHTIGLDVPRRWARGVAAFHGASLHNAFNILCDGANQHRNPGGKIFYSKEPSVAAFYAWRSLSPEQSQISGQGWTNSMFKCHSMMFGLEVAEQAEFYGVDHEANSHQERLMVHHIFALSPAAEETYRDVYGHKYWVQNRSPRPQMEETFRRIHDGRLLREVSEGQRDHGGVLARGRDSSIFTQRASEVLMLNLQFRLYVT